MMSGGRFGQLLHAIREAGDASMYVRSILKSSSPASEQLQAFGGALETVMRRRAEPLLLEQQRCWFCLKTDREVKLLVSGKRAFICDECVTIASQEPRSLFARAVRRLSKRPVAVDPLVIDLFSELVNAVFEQGSSAIDDRMDHLLPDEFHYLGEVILHEIGPRTAKDHAKSCSFCEKCLQETRAAVCAPNACICNECLDRAKSAVGSRVTRRDAKPAHLAPNIQK